MTQQKERVQVSKAVYHLVVSCNDAHGYIYCIFLHIHVNKTGQENICPIPHMHMSPANVDKIQMQTDISTVAHSSEAPASISRLSVPHPLVLPRFTSSKEEERRWTWGRRSKRKQSRQQCRRIKENNKIYGSLGKAVLTG